MRRMVYVMTLGLALTAVVWAAGDETLGAGVKLTEATPIKALYDTPQAFVGKTIRIDGVVTGVCEAMGCWMALAPASTSTISGSAWPWGATVRKRGRPGKW